MNILSEKDNNLLKILTTIYFQKGVLEDYLISQNAITRSKLNSLIDNLNKIIYPSEVRKGDKFFHLYIHQNSSFDFCVSKILSQSLECAILEEIFFERNETYISLAEKLYVSESTVKRSIKLLNTSLELHDISIKTRPLRIEGDERSIRYFFILYFSSKYSLNNLPFSPKEMLQINHIYNIVPRLFRKKSNIQDRSNFTLFTLVAHEREKNLHKIEIENSINKVYLQNIINSFIDKMLKVRKNNSNHLVDIWINTFSLFTKNETLILRQVNLKKKKIFFQKNGIYQFIYLFSKVFKITLTDKEIIKLSSEIHEILFGFLKPINTISPINNSYLTFYHRNDFIMHDYRTLTREIFIKCFPPELHYLFHFVFFVLTINLPDLIDNYFFNLPKISITIYTDFDYKFSEYIKNKLKKSIVANFDFFLIDSYKNLYDKEIINSSDLFVTNVYNYDSLNYSSEKTYLISRHLSKDDIQNLEEKINDIFRNKYEQFIVECKETINDYFIEN